MFKNKEIIFIILIFRVFNFISSNENFPLNPLLPSSLNYIDLIDLDNQLLALQVSMGYPPQKFTLLFDINSDYTWVRGSGCLQCSYSKVFEEKESQTLFKTNISKSWQDLNQNLKGEIVYDYVNVKIFSASNMPFLMVEEDYYIDGVDGVIGFGYGKNSEINFSFLDKLRENNQIRNKIFSFKFNDDISPSLYLGGIPSHIQENNLSYCNVNTTLSSWNCRISHIFVGKDVNFYKAVQLNVDAIFSTINNNIMIPNKYIPFFIQNYFENYPDYESKFCYVKPDGKKSYILCNLKYFDLNKSPILSFIINGYAYKIQPHFLFEQLFSDAYSQFYLFKIVFMESNDWILGSSFLKQFELVFNKDTNQVGFYGGDKYDLTKFTRDRSESTCLYNYFVFFCIFFLITFSMGYIYYKKKQEQKVLYFRSFSDSYKKKEEKEIKL